MTATIAHPRLECSFLLSFPSDLEQALPISTITKLSKRFAVKPLQPLLCSELLHWVSWCAVYQLCCCNSFRVCSSSSVRFVNSPFVLERPGVAPAFIYMAVEGVIFTLLFILLEVSKHGSYFYISDQWLQYYYTCRRSFIIFKFELCLLPRELQLQALVPSDKTR